MARNNYFQFKQFKIIQEKSAMKVNTDGVLLGAWANIEGVKAALDIGTGTGLISLMIAQRSEAIITGVEIEKNAAEEATLNVQNSKWSNRIFIENSSFQDFAVTTQSKFDLIVSNPPFFTNGVKNTNPNVSIARHNHLLPFSDIIGGAIKLLNEKGKLALILPYDQTKDFIEKASRSKLFLTRITEVKPFPDAAPNRCLLEFETSELVVQKTQFSVYDKSRSSYSNDFKNLNKDFYLNL